MAIMKKVLAPCLCLGVLAGCGPWMEIADVERARNEGTAFDRGLFDGYLDLSRQKYASFAWGDQHEFANRARLAAAGTRFEPEAISARSLSDADAGQLTQARARLMAALAAGADETAPKEAAQSQVSFDCWMAQASRGRADSGECRGNFMEAIQLAEAGPQAAAAAAEPPPLPGPYYIMFPFDNAELSLKGQALVEQIMEIWGRAEAKRLVVTGHTDLSGSSEYNMALSEKRAEVVAMDLIEKGFPARDIAIRARGQDEPIMPTADGQQEELNRRVSISFER